jgi:hypothetical protein
MRNGATSLQIILPSPRLVTLPAEV